jgi:hypothetical protein
MDCLSAKEVEHLIDVVFSWIVLSVAVIGTIYSWSKGNKS